MGRVRTPLRINIFTKESFPMKTLTATTQPNTMRA